MLQFKQWEKGLFCQKLGKSPSKTFQIKQVYGEEALGHIAVFECHKRFTQRRDSIEDDGHTGLAKNGQN
jgi:hypothetical protein